MTTVDQPTVPSRVASRVLDSHTPVLLPSVPATSAQRFRCVACGDVAVVSAAGVVFGDATERTCSESQRYQGGPRWAR